MSDIRRPEGGDHDGHGDGGDLPPFDPALRRALDHAPDHAALPDASTRDAIRKIAINAVASSILAPPPPAAAPAPWWRRWLGIGGGAPGSRMPWNAALAGVLVAVLVTVLWHREPVPEAQLDGEAKVAAPAATPAPIAAPAPVSPPPTADVRPAPAEAAPAPPEQASRKAPPPPPAHGAAPGASPRSASQESDGRAATVRTPEPVTPAAPLSQDTSRSEAESAAPTPPLPSEPAVAPAKPAEPVAPSPPVTAPAPSAAAVAPEPRPVFPTASPPAAIALPPARYGIPEAASGSARDASRGAAAAAPVPALPLSSPSPVLARWTALRFTSGSLSVRHAREDIEGLAALVDAVVRSATSTEPGLAAPVEARLTLYRGNTLTGTLEIAGGEVRWTTPQSGELPSTGSPPPQALRALRERLERGAAPAEPGR